MRTVRSLVVVTALAVLQLAAGSGVVCGVGVGGVGSSTVARGSGRVDWMGLPGCCHGMAHAPRSSVRENKRNDEGMGRGGRGMGAAGCV